MGLSLDVDLPLRPDHAAPSASSSAVFRVQGAIAEGFARVYAVSQGFTRIHTPEDRGSAGAEGGANLFKLDYFGQPALPRASRRSSTSSITAGAFGRVFEVGSVYRAERHNTSRHLNEYIGLDFETGVHRFDVRRHGDGDRHAQASVMDYLPRST